MNESKSSMHLERVSQDFSNMVELLRYRAKHQGAEKAFIFLKDGEEEDAYLSYKMLDEQAQAIASKIQEHATKGATVLLCYPNSLDFISAFFGCLYAQAIAVPALAPTSHRNAKDRLESIAQNSNAKLMLSTTSGLAIMGEWYQSSEKLKDIELLTTDNLEVDSSKFVEKSAEINEESTAFIQYSSGSTNTPKGVLVSHSNLLNNMHVMEKLYNYSSKSVFIQWVPLYHDLGLIGHILQTIYLGARCYMMTPEAFLQKPARWLQAISRFKGTVTLAPNFAFDQCVRLISKEQRSTLNLTGLKVAAIGAEPIRADTIARFAETFQDCGFRKDMFYPTYGLAEATLIVIVGSQPGKPIIKSVKASALEHNRIVPADDEKDCHQLVSSGQIGYKHKVLIVDPISKKICAPDQVGEIWIQGSSVAQGYLNAPAETQEVFKASTRDENLGFFLRTGDLGFMQEDEIFVTGRLKELIIINGANYYPQDIEHTIYHSHPAIRIGCGAAFSVEVANSEKLVIVQEIRENQLSGLNSSEVISAIKNKVWEHHKLAPHAVILIKPGMLLKTTSGKIQRKAMQIKFLKNELDAINSADIRPFTNHQASLDIATNDPFCLVKIQNWIMFWLSQHSNLDLRSIAPEQLFTDFGLDSIDTVRLVNDLGKWLSLKLEATLTLKHKAINDLSNHLAELKKHSLCTEGAL